MAANDDMSEHDTQERTQTASGAGQPTSSKREIIIADNQHVQCGDVAGQLDVTVIADISHKEEQYLTIYQELSAITAPAFEGAHREVFTAPSDVPSSGLEESSNANDASQLASGILQQDLTAEQVTLIYGTNGNKNETKGAANSVLGADGNKHPVTEFSYAEPASSPSQAVLAVQGQQEDDVASDAETDDTEGPVENHRRRRVPASVDSHGVSSPAPHPRNARFAGNEDEEQESDDDEYPDDETRDSEDEEEIDEDEERQVAEFQSKLKRSVAQRNQNQKPDWGRRHELFEDGGDVQEVPRQDFDRNFQGQPCIKHEPGVHGYGGPHQTQKPVPHGYDPRLVDPFSGGMFNGQQASLFMSAPESARMPAAPNAPHPFTPNFPYSLPQGQHAMGFQDPHYHSYSQAPYQPGYTLLPVSPYEMQARGLQPPPPPEHYQPPPRGIATVRNVQKKHVPAKKEVSEASEGSDDDEPLRTRVPRHPSKVSDAVEDRSPLPSKATKRGKQPKQESEFDLEMVSSQVKAKPKVGFKDPKATKAAKVAPKKSAPAEQPAQPKQSQPDDQVPTSPVTIDWKLPRYEATFEAPKTKDDPTVAKVSLPNLVREEVLLSPDHAQQEAHLLLQVFLPAHQALAQPDPAPAQAALNFHTIALMVIEAFVQFEIGDEYGTGRGHYHNSHDQSDVEYLRQRSAKDADPDEIFFAVIDRWRAGLESHKESAKMIRGVQEFCDVALDVIYYIKEHGLLKERKNAWEETISKKGAKKVQEDDEESGTVKGKKRGAAVNELTPKKKAKTASKAKKTVEVRKKPKTSGVAVTVVRKR